MADVLYYIHFDTPRSLSSSQGLLTTHNLHTTHTEIVSGNLMLNSHGIGCLIRVHDHTNIYYSKIYTMYMYEMATMWTIVPNLDLHKYNTKNTCSLRSLSCHCHSWFCSDGIYVIQFLRSDQFKLFALDLIGQLLYAGFDCGTVCTYVRMYVCVFVCCTGGHPSLWVNVQCIFYIFLCCWLCRTDTKSGGRLVPCTMKYMEWNVHLVDVFKLKFVANSIEMSRINSG